MDRQKCIAQYPDIVSANKSDKAVWCTLALIALEISMEFLSNMGPKRVEKDVESASSSTTVEPTSQQPQSTAQPTNTPSQPMDETQSTETPQKKTESSSSEEDWLCMENASPQVRANRFAVATVIYAFILWTYISLVRGEVPMRQSIDDVCKPFITAEPHTKSIILSIIVFVCASYAYLRTIVDCILARWNTSLRYDPALGGWVWFPCMPIVMVFAGFGGVFYTVFEGVKVLAAWLTGDSEVSTFTQGKGKGKAKATDEEGVELQEEQDEERRGLVANVDGYDGEELDDDQEGLPAYDDVFTESKGHADRGKVQEV